MSAYLRQGAVIQKVEASGTRLMHLQSLVLLGKLSLFGDFLNAHPEGLKRISSGSQTHPGEVSTLVPGGTSTIGCD